ncbi:hypothetical protein PFICI_00775 [Pestalotiopsis fici W106-1]|uniref:NADAR domain-containing protein n=1 Tax=Pestalotiopsis fici (strain W106-1 / CGMCC3.15140) TaxID=1229662 RepID=W3XN56_PESFW|nr:uncharacterized protein PFICI_00775 [Pestalotiopsis fici W106-1]ETS86947.1 hypothetical protein PFICI_00775 [Pestalotiopsis fici W106-1]
MARSRKTPKVPGLILADPKHDFNSDSKSKSKKSKKSKSKSKSKPTVEEPTATDAHPPAPVVEPPVSQEPTDSSAPETISREDARTAKNKTSSNKPLYFYRESHPRTGFLSQWFTEPFYDPTDQYRNTYYTAEHFMMYKKAMLFKDANTAAEILAASTPKEAKNLGRAVQGFDEEVWVANREKIVRRANYCKFTFPHGGDDSFGPPVRHWHLGANLDAETIRAPSFRAALLRTGDRHLIEASPFDRIWGIGFREADAESNREHWGENLLGKALMAVRQNFKDEEALVS